LLAITPVLFGLEFGADHVPMLRRSLNRLAAWRHTRVDAWMADNVALLTKTSQSTLGEE
jgi:hypothetical protein